MADDFVVFMLLEKPVKANEDSRVRRSIIVSAQNAADSEETSPPQIFGNIAYFMVSID